MRRLTWLLLTGLATSVPAADLTALLGNFQQTVAKAGSQTDRLTAALPILRQYGDYKQLVAAGAVDAATARALDDVTVRMAKETWGKVAIWRGSGLSHIEPIGSFGTRSTPGTTYVPGKSDKDFIPRGRQAEAAAVDFETAFARTYGVRAGDVDIHALSPSDPSSWPKRVQAASNSEKYNTAGGVRAMEAKLAQAEPGVWRLNALTNEVEEVAYRAFSRGPAPKLTPADALGYFSDNTRFIDKYARDAAGQEHQWVSYRSKYDVRNLEAFQLAGGELTAEERGVAAMMTEIASRGGKAEATITRYMRDGGFRGYDAALSSYLKAADALTQRMGRELVDNHASLLRQALLSPRGATVELYNELAGSLANLPPAARQEAEATIAAKLGKAELAQVRKVADAFATRVAALGVEARNERAWLAFNRSYDALGAAEQAVVNGLADAAEGFNWRSLSLSKVFGGGAGLAAAGLGVYFGYQEGAKHGQGWAVIGAGASLIPNAVLIACPAAGAADLAASLAGLLTGLAVNSYKDRELERLYAQYKAEPARLDQLLTEEGATRYAAGLRQFAIELRAQHPGESDAQLDERIKDYFLKRLSVEQHQAEYQRRLGLLKADLDKHVWELVPGTLNGQLEATNPRLYGELTLSYIALYDRLQAQLQRDKIVADTRLLADVVTMAARLAWTDGPAKLREYLREKYKLAGRPFPGDERSPGGAQPPVGPLGPSVAHKPGTPLGVLRAGGADATHTRAATPAGTSGALTAPGSVWAGGGAFPAPKRVDEPAPPGDSYGPFEVAVGGKLAAHIVGNPPVPRTWSLSNTNASLSVYFERRLGSGYGPSTRLMSLSGETKDNDLKQTAALPGPGRLSIYIGVPRGSGALTTTFFGQSYTASLDLVEATASQPAEVGSEARGGDSLSTGAQAAVYVMFDGTTLTVGPQTSLKFVEDAVGGTSVQLLVGKLRRTSPPGIRSAIVVTDKAGRRLRPRGTDFLVSCARDVTSVAVWEGTVLVDALPEFQGAVGAGEQWSSADRKVVPFDREPWREALLGGLQTSELLLDPAPAEPVNAGLTVTADGPGEGWHWEDPGRDCQLAPTASGVAVTVPDGNDFWNNRASAPRLLHPVAGDFDLTADLQLTCAGNGLANVQFLVYSPGDYLGSRADQAPAGTPNAQYRQLGGGWQCERGEHRLGLLRRPWSEWTSAPAGPVKVRLTRRGDVWRAYWSLDGHRWQLSERAVIPAAAGLAVGWLFKRVAADGRHADAATTTLSHVRLTSAARGTLPVPEWDVSGWPGSNSAAGRTVRLEVDPSRPSAALAATGRRYVGDFDAIVRVAAPNWTSQTGDSRSLALWAETDDKEVGAFIRLSEIPGRGRRFETGLARPGTRGTYRWAKAKESSATLRLTRRGDQARTFYQADGKWVRLDEFTLPLAEPVYVTVLADTREDARRAVALNCTCEFLTLDGQTE